MGHAACPAMASSWAHVLPNRMTLICSARGSFVLGEIQVLDWIADKILNILSLVPAWFVEEGSPNFALVRAMFALLLIILVAYLISCWPTIRRGMRLLFMR